MDLVSCRDEILANLLLLDNYSRSPDREIKDWAIGIIQGGQAFVAFHEGDRYLLGPSRFVGYVGNTKRKYKEAQAKGGAETSEQIGKALNCDSKSEPELEQVYQQICQENEVKPHKGERNYWRMS